MTWLRHLRAIEFRWYFLVAMIVANVVAFPQIAQFSVLVGLVASATPVIVGAMAVTPSILSGGGGIDLSIAPLMGLTNILIVTLIPNTILAGPVPAFLAVCAVGAVIGGLNGVLVAVLRLQPIVATLGTFLILGGANLWLLPIPTGPGPDWIVALSGAVFGLPGAAWLIVLVFLIWFIVGRTPYLTILRAVGGDDRVAYSAGLNVVTTRLFAYVLGGVIAAIGGVALTIAIQSADASASAPFTLQIIAAAALGGVSFAGGKGSILDSLVGAIIIFLVTTLLTSLYISIFWQQVASGLILLVALLSSSTRLRPLRRS